MDLYSEIILDYYKHPRNKGPIKSTENKATELNPLCGDKVTIYLKFDKNNKIQKATFEGEGCAISQAATSMLTEILSGKTLEELNKMNQENIFKLLGFKISPGRIKCALLGLETAKKAARIKP